MDKNLKLALVIGGIVVAVLIVLPLVFGLTGGWHGGGWGMPGRLGMPWACGIGGFGGGVVYAGIHDPLLGAGDLGGWWPWCAERAIPAAPPPIPAGPTRPCRY